MIQDLHAFAKKYIQKSFCNVKVNLHRHLNLLQRHLEGERGRIVLQDQPLP